MAASLWARGAVTARLLGVRRLGSSKEAPKRHQQPDLQASVAPGAIEVPTAGNVHPNTPSLCPLQKQTEQQQSGGSVRDDASRKGEGGSGSEHEGQSSSEATTADSADSQTTG